jgi:hypothetical protein
MAPSLKALITSVVEEALAAPTSKTPPGYGYAFGWYESEWFTGAVATENVLLEDPEPRVTVP